MDTINWNNFNFTDFTAICNALLLFEIGKGVQPFEAPGKDGGIDGSFVGSYNGKQGKWRFQYKFHNVIRKAGFQLLKSEVVTEVGNLKGEHYFVLMTNVELLPQEFNELKSKFDNKKAAFAPACEFMLWDGAKLQGLIIGHPLIRMWINDGFETAQLQDYQTYFKRGLEATGFEPFTLNNLFTGREAIKSQLSGFLNSGQLMAVITGEAGIGKTRLVIEFFQQVVECLANWSALVLASKNVDFDKLRNALSGDRCYVILIDDAHKYSPEDIADMKQLAQLSDGRIKLLLTAWGVEASSALRLIKDSDGDLLSPLPLGVLDRAETLAAFEPYLDGTFYSHYKDDLIRLSHGRPILIVAVIRAIRAQMQISKVTETEFLRLYVSNYFESYYEEVARVSGMSVLQAKRLLQNIALIEPINLADSAIRLKLSELHGVPVPDVNYALDLLKQLLIVEGRYEQSIKPDYYSDILLQGIDEDTAATCISEFNAQLDNIIVNLSSIDKGEQGGILDTILEIYVSWIEIDDPDKPVPLDKRINIINRILTTMGHIVYVKPNVAENAVTGYIKALNVDGHPVKEEFGIVKQTSYPLTDTMMNKVILILTRLLSLSPTYEFVYSSVFHLYELTGEKKLANIYHFEKRDVIDGFQLPRQRYFLERLSNRLALSQEDYAYIRQVFQAFLSLEFTITEMSAVARDNMVIMTYFLSEGENITAMRKQVLAQLFTYFNKESLADARLETLKLILDVPRSIFATQRNAKPYVNDEEIQLVMDFLEQKASALGILEQREVLDKLFWFVKWGIDAKFIEQIDRIKLAMKPKDLTEALGQLFSRAEVALLEHGDVRGLMEAKCDEFVSHYSADQLAVAMRGFLEPQPYTPHYYWDFLNVLLRKYTDYAVTFYDYLFASGSPLFYQYGSSVLYTLRFEKDIATFWPRVEALQLLDNWQADNVILLAYGNRVPGTADLTKADIQTVLKVASKKRQENNHALAGGLQTLIAAGYSKAYSVAAEFLDRSHQREAEMFFIWLLDNPKAAPEMIRDLVIGHTARFYLTYEIERALQKVMDKYGLPVIFDYLKSRFNYKKALVIGTRSLMGYEFVPHGEKSHLFDDQRDGQNDLFALALSWYLEEDEEGGHLYYAKDMLEYASPSKTLLPALAEIYDRLVDSFHADLNKLGRLADSLSIFETKSPLLVTLVIKIYLLVLELKRQDEEKARYITFYLQNALTSMGVKMGTPGQPFQVDLDLRTLLQEELLKLPEFNEGRNFITNILNSLNNSIDRERFDNDTW